jgi:Protein of unknown function (DUF3800)
MIFLDAAGLSNPEHEPHIVVAGVITHPDSQWKALRDYLLAMADQYVPLEHRANFAFHATELFSGGKVFPREKYPKEWRWGVLDELLSVVRQFDLPVVWGSILRTKVEAAGQLAPSHPIPAVVRGQMVALNIAAVAAEHWMNKVAEEDEVAQMIMENDNQSRTFMRLMQRYLSDPKYHARSADEYNRLKLSRVIYPMHFEGKTDSSALQVADACAFAIKRWLMGKPEAERFFGPLRPYLVNTLKTEGEKA